jgi:hypothetical protein
MMSPGSGAGNQAAALASLEKKVLPEVTNAMLAFPVGSSEFKEIKRAWDSLTALVGKHKTSPGPEGGKMSIPPGIAPTNQPPPGFQMPPGMSGQEELGGAQ